MWYYCQRVAYDNVIKWKPFPRYWPFVRGINLSPVNSPHKGQWHGALMFSLICAWIYGWVNNGEAGDLRRHHGQYDVIVMKKTHLTLATLYALLLWTCSINRDRVQDRYVITYRISWMISDRGRYQNYIDMVYVSWLNMSKHNLKYWLVLVYSSKINE